MKYFFGIENNYVEFDLYKELNLQLQNFIQEGYILKNGILSIPEEKQFLIKDAIYTIGEIPNITVDKTGWYCPNQLAGNKYFIHKGQLKKKKTIDWSGMVTTMYNSSLDEEKGNPLYTIAPEFYNEIKEQLLIDGIGALQIGEAKYENHNFIIMNIPAMDSLDDYYELFVLNRSE